MAALFAGLAIVRACPDRAYTGKYVVGGARSMQPVVTDWLAAFGRLKPDFPTRVEAGGTTAAVRSVMAGDLYFAMSGRPLQRGERAHSIVVAREVVAVAVHPDNPVAGLRAREVVEIFAGRLTRWSQVGGPDAPITVVVPAARSDLRVAFDDVILSGAPAAPGAVAADSGAAVAAAIGSDPWSIGYLRAGALDEHVRALPIDGAPATPQAVEAGRYVLAVPLTFVFRVPPTRKRDVALIGWIRGPEGREVARRHGLAPAPDDDRAFLWAPFDPEGALRARLPSVQERLDAALDAWLSTRDLAALRRSVEAVLVTLDVDADRPGAAATAPRAGQRTKGRPRRSPPAPARPRVGGRRARCGGGRRAPGCRETGGRPDTAGPCARRSPRSSPDPTRR
jgi:phosphate transport system substrate-binding protein